MIIQNDHIYLMKGGQEFLVVALAHSPHAPTVEFLPRGATGFELGAKTVTLNAQVFTSDVDVDLGPSRPEDLA